MRETRSRPQPTLWPSPKPPLCPRLPWRAGSRHPRPGLLSCARTRQQISSPAAGRPGQDIDRGTQPDSPTAWWVAGPQTDLADPRGNQGQGLRHHLFGRVSPRGLPRGRRTDRLRCECSPGPVHRDAKRCVADARSGKEACSSSIGISDTPTLPRREASSQLLWIHQDSPGVPPKNGTLCCRSGGTMACHVSVVPPAGRAPFWCPGCVAYIRCQKQSFPLPHGHFSWRYRSLSATRIHQ